MASAEYLIYSGIIPSVKMYLTILVGFVLARKNLFPPAASRGASMITMNVALPALIFSSIVPAFTPANTSAIGPLALIAVVYVLLGAVFGLIIREVCYIPRNFWQGVIIATALSNWGNLPNAVVLSITQQSPFNPATDPKLGVSFVSIFTAAYHIFFWVVGGAHSLSWDYLPGVPQGEEAERRVSWKEKPVGAWIAKMLRRQTPIYNSTQGMREKEDSPTCLSRQGMNEKGDSSLSTVQPGATQIGHSGSLHEESTDRDLSRRPSRLSTVFFHLQRSSASGATLPTHTDEAQAFCPSGSTASSPLTVVLSLPVFHYKLSVPRPVLRFLKGISAVVTPITFSIAVSITISLVLPLKALFVDTRSMGGPSWLGPDGRPPLAFVIDMAEFVGTMCVPLALIILGASFARLRIPRQISRLPIPAIVAVCLAKMAVLPVIGVFMVQAMTKARLVPAGAKIELFVAMFLSGTPSAVNQLIVSSLYSPDGELDTLSAFLLAQYAFMFFSSAALTAVSLLLI